MNKTIPGHFAPSAGFEAPLEMLSACHARIEHQCSTLRRMLPYLARHGTDAEARAAARAVMRYFDSAAPQHHADEEQDLFPALIESMAGSDAVCLRKIIAALSADHRALEAGWQRVRGVLDRVAAGEPVLLDADDVESLIDAYARHIQREEDELLPMAQRLLSDDVLAHIGRAMRERRAIGVVV